MFYPNIFISLIVDKVISSSIWFKLQIENSPTLYLTLSRKSRKIELGGETLDQCLKPMGLKNMRHPCPGKNDNL